MILKIAGIIIGILFIGVLIIAKSKGVSPLSWGMHKPFSQANHVAIKGFDPVSYFENSRADEGQESISYKWNDVNWQFNSQEHLEAFKANPEKYAPRFGGYCSFAVSKGFTATPDPKAWYIYEGRLHLFADENMKNNWVEQLPEVLEISEGKWR